jgi:hypothetical protein
MNAQTGQYQVLDTFLLQDEILSPGTFLYHPEEQQVEYINDSLHYFFRRGKKEADTFFIDKGAYCEGPPLYVDRNESFRVNRSVFLNYKIGKYHLVPDTLGADYVKVEILPNGNERLIYLKHFPHSLDPSISKPDSTWILSKQQDSLIFSYVYIRVSSDTIGLYRVENGLITSRQIYNRPVNSDFEIRQVHSFHDGSFILSGYVDYYNANWGESSANSHLIFIDKNGKASRISSASNFQLHYHSDESELKVFYDNSWAQLDYRIVDSSGRSLQKGNFKVYYGINIGN